MLIAKLNKFIAVGLLLLSTTIGFTDGLVAKLGIGYSEEATVNYGFNSRRNPVAVIDASYSHGRMTYGLDLSARFGNKSIANVAGASFGELKTVNVGQYYQYKMGDYVIEYRHLSDHVQGVSVPGFADVYQRNSIMLWRTFELK